MHPLLLTAIAILHLGPGIAFAVVAFGCGNIDPMLGNICETGNMKLFAVTTLLSWVTLILIALAVHFWTRMKKSEVQ
jgi:hypothetical protein